MKRLLIVVGTAVAVFVLAACHSSDPIITSSGVPVHWMATQKRSTVRTIDVVVSSAHMSNAGFARGVNVAIAEGDRSPHIDLVLKVVATLPETCPIRHCITITRAP